MDLSLTPNQADSELLSRTMRVLSSQEAKEGVSRQVEEPLQDKGGVTKWDLSFAEYIEEQQELGTSILPVRLGGWNCFQSGRSSWHLGDATRRHPKQGDRTGPPGGLSRGSGEAQRSGLIWNSSYAPSF